MTTFGTDKKDELTRIDPALVSVLKTLCDEYDKEDRQERDEKRPLWLKLEHYFNGLQRIYYDMVARDYRSVDVKAKTQTNRHYDKIINIYRGHAESIIAALSIKPPSAIFYPADADVEEDVTTAKACTKMKEEIEKVNEAQLVIIKTLLILFNQGTVASYIYNKKDAKYGTYTKPKYAKEPMPVFTTLLNCPECQSNIDEVVFRKEKGKVPEEVRKCEVCGYEGIPNQEEYEESVPEIVGSDIYPKSRTCIDVYSPLFVYIPFYARRQEHIPYLRLRFEQHYAALKNIYPRLKKKGLAKSSVDAQNAEERGIRIGLNSSNLSTVDCWWIRDWAYDLLDDKEEEVKKLKKNYPDGIYLVMIDDEIVEVNNENLDDHWEISYNPLSTYVHGEPIGKPLAPIQELKTEVTDLQIETLEHAIPETWARPDVVDFKKYEKSQAAPGMMYPSLPAADPGESLASAFHTIKTATLSEESEVFSQKLDNAAQFAVGSFPSIYGGPSTSGSKTAREYSESRAMALQRLSLVWNMLKFFWAGTMSKAVPLFMQAVKQTGEDLKIVERSKTGFVNNWIRQSQLDGTLGRIEADADESLPLSPAQLKGVIMELVSLKDETLSEAIFHPENTPFITKALGAPDFYVPNSDDRNKQYDEFGDLLSGIPVPVKGWENHAIEGEVCRSFLVSPTGLMIRRSNPEGYQAIEDHMAEHSMAMQGKGKQEEVTEGTIEQPQPQIVPGSVNPEGALNV